jgi:hypothetical protein
LELLEPVDGDLALGLTTIGALAARGAGGLATAMADPAAFVNQFPESLRRHVSIRLAVPEFQAVEVARTVLVHNLQKLARLHQRRERASVVEELRRAAATGDVDAELSLLQRQMARAKARHGLV